MWINCKQNKLISKSQSVHKRSTGTHQATGQSNNKEKVDKIMKNQYVKETIHRFSML